MILQQDPRDPAFVQDPYSLYRQWHITGQPVFWKNYGFWCLPAFSMVNSVLRDRRFARLPPAGKELPPMPAHLADFQAAEKHSLLALEPPDHTRLRKRVNRAFLGRQINGMEGEIRQIARGCLDQFAAYSHCDLLKHYATPIPVKVITKLLGVPEEAGPDLVRWSHAMVRVYTMTQTRDDELAANQAAAEFQAYLATIIAHKRQNFADDLISHLIREQSGEQALTNEEIISVLILLLNAGHEATVHQLGNAVHLLLSRYPATKRTILLDLLASDDTADSLVSECLRFASPLHLFIRYAQEEVQLTDSLTVNAGDQVGLMLAAANRCPVRFRQPDAFEPTRSDAGYLSLGAGIHFCVGAQLAKVELRIALQELFARLPDLQADGPVAYQNAYHFHGLTQLPVRWGS